MPHLQCHEVTAEVEKVLGKVTYTQPTAEQFEEPVTVTTTEQVKDTTNGGGSNWGQSGGGSSGSGWSKY